MERAVLSLARVAVVLALCAHPTAAQVVPYNQAAAASTKSGIILVRIETNATEYKVGEPIWLRVALINKSSHELYLNGAPAPFQITDLTIVDARGHRLPSLPKPSKDSMIGNSGMEFRQPLPPGKPVYMWYNDPYSHWALREWADVRHWGYHIGQPGEYTLVASPTLYVGGAGGIIFKASPSDKSNKVRVTAIRGRATNFAAPTSPPIPIIRVRAGNYSASTMHRACATPNAEATVTNPVRPEYPESAKEIGLGPVTVEVEVVVGPTGNLSRASIYKSSNNMAIDQAALRAARESSYSPKLVNCQPTQGDYLFLIRVRTGSYSAPTMHPACAAPDVSATVINPVQAEYPASFRDLSFGPATVEVEVTVGPAGNLLGTRVVKSSGNAFIDDAAVRAARESTYSPRLVNCQPTQGNYLLRAILQPH
jgi:TonB family protein